MMACSDKSELYDSKEDKCVGVFEGLTPGATVIRPAMSCEEIRSFKKARGDTASNAWYFLDTGDLVFEVRNEGELKLRVEEEKTDKSKKKANRK